MFHWHVTAVGRLKAPRDKRQGLATQDVLNHCRINVSHPITKACISPGHAIVKFVWMKHERIAGDTVAQRAYIVKALDARQRAADGVGVMSMRIVAVAAEPRFNTLDSSWLNTADDPVSAVWLAFFPIHECVRSRACSVVVICMPGIYKCEYWLSAFA